jgi:tRNA (guanine37-N1)-methyltransferase
MAFAVTVLSLYPAMFPGPLGHALAGRALSEGIWSLETVDIRDFARDKHRSVDDTPAGGGPGMVMRADVLIAAIDAALAKGPGNRPLVHLTPRGRPLTQARLRDWQKGPGLVIVCGRFEGIDERVYRARPGEEVSLGDFVLSGGEMAAFALIDGVVRLLPGVMGAEGSLAEESFEGGLLEYPHYTRPKTVAGEDIPAVLQSGDHAAIAAWRRREAELITRARRPDLLERRKDDEAKS